MRETKWDILRERYQKQLRYLEQMKEEMHGLEHTKCGLTCGYCGKLLATEADFAKHFIILDRRFLNLGECPEDPRSGLSFF